MDIKFYADNFKFSGFHHDLMGSIEKSGVVQFTNKILDKTGIYKADLIVGGKFIRDKTFFPSSWSRKQVLEAIYEAYDNYKKAGVFETAGRGGTYTIKGFTNQGVQILMTITENGLITTAYPIITL